MERCRKRNAMSHTSVMAILKNGETEEIEELRNSWGSAPVIWGAMCKKYLGNEVNYLKQDTKLWDLYKDPTISKRIRVVLLLTFDNFYVEKKDFKRMAEDIEFFMQNMDTGDGVNHWKDIATIFRGDPHVVGIGFSWTSVCDNPFVKWDYENDKQIPINLDDFESVYAEMEVIE
jgi:hypothetical protein